VLAFVDGADAALTELADQPVVAEHVAELQPLSLIGIEDELGAVFGTCTELVPVDAPADYTVLATFHRRWILLARSSPSQRVKMPSALTKRIG
jgi:hypothetical protein